MVKLYYTVHVNWEWVVNEALEIEAAKKQWKLERVRVSRELPSRNRGSNSSSSSGSRGYALFRLEYDSMMLAATNTLFTSLDRKDYLYQVTSKKMDNINQIQVMPSSQLLSWDIADGDINDDLISKIHMPTNPCLLKSSIL